MTPDQRRAIVIANEGNALSSAGHHGPEGAAEFTRLTIDGLLNALIRIEGAEAASTYAFALSDRVCGGLREPTDFRSPQVAALAAPAVETATPPKPAPDTRFRWRAYALGLVHGVILAWMLGALRS